MKVLRTISEVREFRRGQGSLGFVPTMGALHAGHLHLMKQAVAENNCSMGSIFVNPLQFGPNEDLSRYPRQELADLELAKDIGLSAMFCPTVDEMVGGHLTTVSVRTVSDLYEGEHRPGHFDGVATIVARLFGIVLPTKSYFGLKDLQQCAVVRQMVNDLCLPVELRFLETVREESGLALSSRNNYLNSTDRLNASLIYQVLQKISGELRNDITVLSDALLAGRAELEGAHFQVEYLDLVDEETMQRTAFLSANSRLIIAARYQGVRLIDNILVNP